MLAQTLVETVPGCIIFLSQPERAKKKNQTRFGSFFGSFFMRFGKPFFVWGAFKSFSLEAVSKVLQTCRALGDQ